MREGAWSLPPRPSPLMVFAAERVIALYRWQSLALVSCLVAIHADVGLRMDFGRPSPTGARPPGLMVRPCQI